MLSESDLDSDSDDGNESESDNSDDDSNDPYVFNDDDIDWDGLTNTFEQKLFHWGWGKDNSESIARKALGMN